MMSGLNRSAAACSAATSSTARKALSFLRKPTFARLSSCAMKLWPEVVRRVEGEERGHTHHHRTENLIADIEVIVGEAATLASEDAVMRVLGGIFRQADTEARTLLHALEDDCVKKMREHRAAREMKVGPSESTCRGGLQTAISCFGQKKTAVVNVMVKRRDYDHVRYDSERRAQANLR